MITDAIKQAQALAREAQEATYDGRCTVMEHQKLKDPKSSVSAVDQTESAAKTAQVTKLFLSPDVQIKPGAKITVTQAGVTQNYKCGSVAAVYPTHQEIVLQLSERYA